MAKCDLCGTEISFFNLERECDSCKARTESLRTDYESGRHAFFKQYRHERYLRIVKENKPLVEEHLHAIREQLASTPQVTIYMQKYLPVDSTVETLETETPFDIEVLNAFGNVGWELVSFVPKTIGVGLTNAANTFFPTKSWGGGIGGNIIGVYAIMKLTMTSDTIDRADKALEAYYIEKTPAPPEYVTFRITSLPGTRLFDIQPIGTVLSQHVTLMPNISTSLPYRFPNQIAHDTACYVQHFLSKYGIASEFT